MSRSTEMALRYLDGLRAELRKQNTEKLKGFGKKPEVAMEPTGDEEMGEDELSSLLGDDMPLEEVTEGEAPEGDEADKLKKMLSKG